tara:strand:+ start:39 stop:824 length:786 start_codon:yes stop_codon:yes gene_type:complete
MKTKVKPLILTGYGINCDYETYHAFKEVGSSPEYVHVNELISKRKNMLDYNLLVFPGGFSFGDDIASGKVLANKFKFKLRKELEEFIEKGNLIIGICNGFQAMVKLGILPELDKGQLTTLTFNDSGKFEDRWVYVKVNPNSNCVFTKGIKKMYLPVRHGEGKFMPMDDKVLGEIKKNNQVVVQYSNKREELLGYPYNPNGSVGNIAGICDKTGRIFGLMPHPEAHFHYTNHPRWTRFKKEHEHGHGYRVFRNAVEFVEKNL